MQVPESPITLEELKKFIDNFLSEKCKKEDGKIVCKKCDGAIRVGFIHCFVEDKEGNLDPGHDGFGLGKKRVPYCENCDPPDGFRYTYSTRLGIIKN